ncbi:acryloyl-CoA reductase [Mechercharimyces sp. CAU 1602]|uniref:acrylyl-CoA reductase family protein n=1 Tax=Mechercharimyces sp. CAU 1602 TaxID=2973933 RepID=UPI00216186A5|nr:acryloyl-CoA reductase [Mechercharimyces sp. CAU 1602]MCS1351940.1 acryloyl-CoA reductase [Mechercharimyces sp. CAU 1602]
MTTFRALYVHKGEEEFTSEIRSLTLADIDEGEVIIEVKYSSINFKDGLASIPNGRILEKYPMVPGIDLAGIVLESQDDRYQVGDEVIAGNGALGVSHTGGFSEVARIPAEWVIPLPQGLSLKDAMALGTAGFTAAMSIQRLEENGLRPGGEPVLVTGATGGVGCTAIAMLSQRGYDVVASTGKESEHTFLRELGASDVIGRVSVDGEEKVGPLSKRTWAGAVDPVGGNTLSYLLRTMDYSGSIAVSGLTGGATYSSTVYPLILRGVNVLGIDTAHISREYREQIWKRLATDLKIEDVADRIAFEISLDQLPTTLEQILAGKMRGRAVLAL